MKKNIRKIIAIFGLIIVSTVVVYFLNSYKTNYPNVESTIKLENITSEEYNSNELEKYNIKDIKKILIKIDISNSKNCKKRDIQIPDLNAIDEYDKVRSLKSGNTYINNLNKESNAQSMKYIIFDSSGLSIGDIKKIYKGKKISVKIITPNNKDISYSYDIGEMLNEE